MLPVCVPPVPLPVRVLVVEDDDHIAMALEFVIGREGMAYDRIAIGSKAVPRIRSTRPDLVMLDIILPELSGYDICLLVREDPALAGVKLLMMTARGSAMDRQRALAVGADGFVAKPFDLAALRAEMRRVLADR